MKEQEKIGIREATENIRKEFNWPDFSDKSIRWAIANKRLNFIKMSDQPRTRKYVCMNEVRKYVESLRTKAKA